MIPHTFGEWTVWEDPTCLTPGREGHRCIHCRYPESITIPALGHDWEVTVTEPTCTTGGYTTYHCCNCLRTYTEDETEALGHDWQITVTESTCTEGGYTTYTCRTCATSFRINETEALGHDYIDGSCTRCGAAEPVTFADVPTDSFYHEPVQWAVEQGITAGTGEGTFSPENTCMRAHAVTFLWRAEGCPEPESTDNPFTDVTEADFYYKAVLWAVEQGITNGISANRFGPYESCNRAQVVTFLWRAKGCPAAASEPGFTDVTSGAWYAAPIAWAVELGITNGMGDGTFGVDIPCNRAQMVTFLYRAYHD